jgi:Protein of unknown function (DUF4031)
VTIFVDDMRARLGRMIMCHMIADSEAELHAMAERIGIPRRSYQGDHYDISRSKRAMAVRAGAREVTLRQLAAMLWLNHNGQPMGEPETAVERMMAARATLRDAARGRRQAMRR